jgi:hypothetical protein
MVCLSIGSSGYPVLSTAIEKMFPIKTLGTIEDQELKQVISHFNKSSSPGFDVIPYKIWGLFPALRLWLLKMFKGCYALAWIPQHWKISKTILLPKNGDPNDLANWRPVSLQNTAGKIYAAVIDKLLRYAVQDRLPRNQKGFVKYTPGCAEHDYYVQAMIRKARRKNQPLYMCSYDTKKVTKSLRAL